MISQLLEGKTPPWIRRIESLTLKSMAQHDMANPGDGILLSISGGKDSLALALVMALLKKRYNTKWRLEAVQVDWMEYPVPAPEREALKEFLARLSIPYSLVSSSIHPENQRGKFNCYICSRNRRRVIFEAAESRGLKTIATGHHLDDLAENVLINISQRGSLEALSPKRSYFDHRFTVIRPMLQVPETSIIRLRDSLEFPVIDIGCPYRDENLRARMKPVVKALVKENPRARQQIYRSFFP